ncbi:MAG: NtaA/DmoA family FMN-dependent monooxygenase [Arthrobacter sp.]|nr:NtaA/DmoA family FMN-dependent monooxygenase [Arthrobacter sp.]
MSAARKRLLLGAFLMNTPSHILGGGWRHPDAQQLRYNELSLWTDLAKRLEEAAFDTLFLADVVGVYGDHDGGWASHVRRGLQVPSNDPLVLASALAAVTDKLGLAFTSSVVQAHPFQFARQLSTLDHLTNGRVGWNIVTSVLENAHRNFGATSLVAHDDRYEWAEEYVDVAYRLWEGSWDRDAVLADKAGDFADPAKVNKIGFEGHTYKVDGPHLVTPSPQGTPYLFQAGSSDRGRRFAAKHAEATFLFAPHPEYVAKQVASLRALEAEAGRTRGSVKVFAGLHVLVGSTEAEVSRKLDEFEEYLDLDAIVAHIGGGIGVDLGGLPLDATLADVETEGARGVLEALFAAVPNGNPTIADVARYRARGQLVAGTPESVADELERWQDAGTDGINLINFRLPGTYIDFIEGALPELRRRGLAQSSYGEGATLRERLGDTVGDGQIAADHPAARHRGAFSHLSAAATNLQKQGHRA